MAGRNIRNMEDGDRNTKFQRKVKTIFTETAAAWTIWTRDINTAWRLEGHLASFPILASHLISTQ